MGTAANGSSEAARHSMLLDGAVRGSRPQIIEPRGASHTMDYQKSSCWKVPITRPYIDFKERLITHKMVVILEGSAITDLGHIRPPDGASVRPVKGKDGMSRAANPKGPCDGMVLHPLFWAYVCTI